jgi:hypothetical protein
MNSQPFNIYVFPKSRTYQPHTLAYLKQKYDGQKLYTGDTIVVVCCEESTTDEPIHMRCIGCGVSLNDLEYYIYNNISHGPEDDAHLKKMDLHEVLHYRKSQEEYDNENISATSFAQ